VLPQITWRKENSLSSTNIQRQWEASTPRILESRREASVAKPNCFRLNWNDADSILQIQVHSNKSRLKELRRKELYTIKWETLRNHLKDRGNWIMRKSCWIAALFLSLVRVFTRNDFRIGRESIDVSWNIHSWSISQCLSKASLPIEQKSFHKLKSPFERRTRRNWGCKGNNFESCRINYLHPEGLLSLRKLDRSQKLRKLDQS